MNNLSRNLLILVTLLLTSAVNADDLTNVNEIISRANLASYYAADDGRAEARMRIVDSQGNSQTRQFTILRKDREDEGDQDMLVFFSRPTDISGTVFRVVKKVESDDDRWLYLPALDLVKRISAGDKRTSFVGAHFYYEDVSGRNPDEDNFTLINSSGDLYTIKAEPKDANSVEFSYYIAEIDKNTFLPMQVSYFNNQEEMIRQMQVLSTTNVDGYPTVTHTKITQFPDNSYTEMQFRKVEYNLGLPDSIFSERSLRNPPGSWIR